MKSLYTKLLKFQQMVSAVEKDSTNPFLKNKYADVNQFLATIKPVLSEVGLILLQPLTMVEGKQAIKTIIADPETGESIEETITLIEDTNPQKFGSVVSYFRRYAMQSILSLETTDDDDGNAGSGTVAKASPASKKSCEKCKKEFIPKPSFAKYCNDCKAPF